MSIKPPIALWYGLALGLLLTVLWLLPVGQTAEREYGLTWLYQLRGPVKAPEGIVIAGIDRETTEWLADFALDPDGVSLHLKACLPTVALTKLSTDARTDNWPREVYACLLDRLTELGAAVIVLDINFRGRRADAEDRALATAIERADRVVITQKIRQYGPEVTRDPASAVIVQELPSPRLAKLAVVAPFPLPNLGHRIDEFWVDFPAPHGDQRILTLPAADLRALRRGGGRAGTTAAGEDMPAYGRRPIWFYGPIGTIPTVPMWRILAGAEIGSFASSVVFVGTSDLLNPDQRDGFRTVFRNLRGVDLSGVEIAATAFANLRDGTLLTRSPMAGGAAIVFALGVLLAYSGTALARYRGVVAILLIWAVFAALAYVAFARLHLWLPVFIPLVVGPPVAILCSIIVRYEAVKRLVTVLTPEPVARRLITSEQGNLEWSDQESVTVLVTDLAEFTAMAEKLAAPQIFDFLNAHFQDVDDAVQSEGGVVDKFMGDGVLAIFGAPVAYGDHAVRACRAAKKIAERVRNINGSHASSEFPRMRMRMGINTGPAMVGEIGAQGRHNFTVLGDVVNVASRLERLGKDIAPNDDVVALIGEMTAHELTPSDAIVADLGLSRLRGRREPVRVFQLKV